MSDGSKASLAWPLSTLSAGVLIVVLYASFMSDAAGGGGANIGGGFLLIIGYLMTGTGLIATLIALIQRRR